MPFGNSTAKLEAKRDLKIARAQSEPYQIARGVKFASAGITVILLGISSCAASLYGHWGTSETDIVNQMKYETCIEAGGDWDGYDKSCDQ